jgi:hypothetical protein
VDPGQPAVEANPKLRVRELGATLSGWRNAFDAVERSVSPRVETVVHSKQFARMTAVVARSRRLAGGRADAIAARFWHLANLPAGTDLQRLRQQVGALDRELRRLSLQLDRDSRKPE